MKHRDQLASETEESTEQEDAYIRRIAGEGADSELSRWLRTGFRAGYDAGYRHGFREGVEHIQQELRAKLGIKE